MSEHIETPEETDATTGADQVVDNDSVSDPDGTSRSDADQDVDDHADAEVTNVEPETFTREYVQNLRDESAKYRTRAKDRDAVAERLHGALVAATGRLADPSDLPFDDGHLTDAETLTTAIDDLLATKPHLASRKPAGDIGQGSTGGTESVDLAGMLRARAS